MTTTNQAIAIECFSNMLAAAESYHETGSMPYQLQRYGICDNISNFAKERTSDMVATVKDNLIRRTPSYSGCYHYPVPADSNDPCDAEGAFDNSDNKWAGAYGLRRMQQLRELIVLCNTEWDEELTTRLSPARRLGIKVGDFMQDRHGNLFELTRDDGSSNPAFMRLGSTESHYKDIDKLFPVKDQSNLTGKPRSVKSLVKEADKINAKIAKIEEQMGKLNEQVRELTAQRSNVDVALRVQHKVQRLTK
jgi:hypothetical protein